MPRQTQSIPARAGAPLDDPGRQTIFQGILKLPSYSDEDGIRRKCDYFSTIRNKRINFGSAEWQEIKDELENQQLKSEESSGQPEQSTTSQELTETGEASSSMASGSKGESSQN